MVRSPVEICRGTSPSQAPKSRPLENTAPLPIAATIALEMIGPMPGTVAARRSSFRAPQPADKAASDPGRLLIEQAYTVKWTRRILLHLTIRVDLALQFDEFIGAVI